MWTLIVPLVLGWPTDYDAPHMTYQAQYETAEACEAARAALEQRVRDAEAIPFSGAVPGRWAVTERMENVAAVDQPEGVAEGWAYVNPRVGYCAISPSEPSARAPNVTS